MAKKKYDSYNPDLFDNTNHNSESTPESVHLKGTGVGKSDTDTQDSTPDRRETEVSKNQDDIQLEEQYGMDLSPNSLINIAKNGIEGFRRLLMGEYEDRHNIERESDSYIEVTSSEPKSQIPEENVHHGEPQTQISERRDDDRHARKTADESTTRRCDRRYGTDSWRRDDFERKQKEREEKELQGFVRRQKEREEKERREFERQERERKEKERREFERQERERKEKERREFERQERERKEIERQEKELQEKKVIEHDVLNYSEIIPSISEDCYIALFTEKKNGLGEDSMPLIYRSANTFCVGVFDGMGGAGAAEYPTLTIGNKTGAYLSSRVVRAVCFDWLNKKGKIEILGLKEEISKYFNYLLSIWNIKPSGLRSGFVRVLPTTLAMVEATRSGNKTEVSSYWAGDSRNYVLQASGLKQLSYDDLRQPKDPLENLRSDDALSNCICQDKPFEINVKRISFNEPIIILSATDGCFGYLLTPMHFEFILLDCLMKTSNCTEWSEAIRKTLSQISSDDFTIGLQIVDGDFNYWKNLLHVRYEFLKESVIKPIEQMKAAYEKAIKECAICEHSLHNGITEFWQQYKEEFLLTNQSYHNDN